MQTDYISLTDCAHSRGVLPRVISDLFYQGKLDREKCLQIAGRTLIPKDYAETVIGPMLADRRGSLEVQNAR